MAGVRELASGRAAHGIFSAGPLEFQLLVSRFRKFKLTRQGVFGLLADYLFATQRLEPMLEQ